MKLNVGSGQRKFDISKGWINVDRIYSRGTIKVGDKDVPSTPDVAADAAQLPFKDCSASMVVCHHLLEHLGCGDGDGLIKESYRVLCPGSSLLVFTPNLRALAARWLVNQISEYTYMVNSYGAYMGKEEDRHKWGYSQEGLLYYLQLQASWSEVKLFDWRSIEGAEIARDFWIAGVEAVK